MRDPIRSGASLEHGVHGRWLTPADIGAPLMVLVHGFTANGTHLRSMAEYAAGHGFVPAIFQYDSYLGIDDAARKLGRHLSALPRLPDAGLVLIGHSMGGLVGRLTAVDLPASIRRGLRAVVTLGTPNRGVRIPGLINYMLDWAESLSDPHPYARAKACRSTQQLTCVDRDRLIESLAAKEQRVPTSVPMLSVSGGLPLLEAGKGRMRDGLFNEALQEVINETPNDGLIPESSADLRLALPGVPDVMHLNDYAEYHTTNHTHLIQNQEIAASVMAWLQRMFSVAVVD